MMDKHVLILALWLGHAYTLQMLHVQESGLSGSFCLFTDGAETPGGKNFLFRHHNFYRDGPLDALGEAFLEKYTI